MSLLIYCIHSVLVVDNSIDEVFVFGKVVVDMIEIDLNLSQMSLYSIQLSIE